MQGPSTRNPKPVDKEEQKRQQELASDAQPLDEDHVESDEEQQARESEKAFDQAVTRIPPG